MRIPHVIVPIIEPKLIILAKEKTCRDMVVLLMYRSYIVSRRSKILEHKRITINLESIFMIRLFCWHLPNHDSWSLVNMISLDGFLRLGKITPVSPMLHPTEITPAFTATATNTYQNHSKKSTVCQSINMINNSFNKRMF